MPTETLNWNGEELRCFTNVTTYSFVEEDNYAWQITYESNSISPNTSAPSYFILDTYNHSAFSHWVYENAAWLPLFNRLRQQYPQCKLVLEEYRQYKNLYLDFYGIPLDAVCLHRDIPSENICFFHAYTCLNDLSIPSVFYQHILEYKSLIDTIQPTTRIPLLYLPRGTKENLQGPNNRVYNIQENIKHLVKSMGGTVYETDKTNSLIEQIKIVKSAQVIILDYGSNLWVNGLSAENSKILCLNIGWQHHDQFTSLEYIWNMINKANSVTQVFAYPSEQTADSDVPVVCFHLHQIVYTLHQLLEVARNEG